MDHPGRSEHIGHARIRGIPAACRGGSDSDFRVPPPGRAGHRAQRGGQPDRKAAGGRAGAGNRGAALTYKRNTSSVPAMGILTVRLTEEEEQTLARRSRSAGMKKATFIRHLIREQPLESAADVFADSEKRMGDTRLRISRR